MKDDDEWRRGQSPSRGSGGCMSMVLVTVGGFLVLVPGGCALAFLPALASVKTLSDAAGALFVLAILAAIAFAGIMLIRDTLK